MLRKKNVYILSSLMMGASLLSSSPVSTAYAGGIHNFIIHNTPITTQTPSAQTTPANTTSLISTVHKPEVSATQNKTFELVYGHIVVAELHGTQKLLEHNLPYIASAKNNSEFVRLLKSKYRGANVLYNNKISYLLNTDRKIVYSPQFAFINGGSCFNVYAGKQVNTPEGFTGGLINSTQTNQLNIDLTLIKRTDNDKCETSQTHRLFHMATDSTNNMFSLGYDNATHAERVFYLSNETRHHLKANK